MENKREAILRAENAGKQARECAVCANNAAKTTQSKEAARFAELAKQQADQATFLENATANETDAETATAAANATERKLELVMDWSEHAIEAADLWPTPCEYLIFDIMIPFIF